MAGAHARGTIVTSLKTPKPELFLLQGKQVFDAEKLARLFTRLTGKPTTAQEAQQSLDGAEARARGRGAIKCKEPGCSLISHALARK